MGVDFDEHLSTVIAALEERADELGTRAARRQAAVASHCQRPPAFAHSPMWSAEQNSSGTRYSPRCRISCTWTSPISASQWAHFEPGRRHAGGLVRLARIPVGALDRPRDDVLEAAEHRVPRAGVLGRAVAVPRRDVGAAPGAAAMCLSFGMGSLSRRWATTSELSSSRATRPGQELLEQSLRVLDPDVTQVPLDLVRYDLSLEKRRETDNRIVEEAAVAMAEAGYGLKAATVTPEGADDVGSPNRILRENIDGKVIIRTGRRIPGVTPVAGVHYPISVVRMAVGDAYGAKQWRETIDENGDEIAYRTERISRSVCRMVAEHSFRTARKIHGRVYGGPKWTVSPGLRGHAEGGARRRSERHPEVPYQPVLIDATYAGLVGGAADAPLVIPALNRDGDCLSDMVLPLFGSIAGAESVLLSLDENYEVKTVMAEAPHGTAPQLEGKNVANPMAMIMAAAALLHYVSVDGRRRPTSPRARSTSRCSRRSRPASRRSTSSGTATMTEFTDEVINRVRTKIDIWSSLGTTV